MKIKICTLYRMLAAPIVIACLLFSFTLTPFFASDAKESQSILLYDFETQYERANVISKYAIGKLNLSNKHVTSGKNSLYLEISGIFPEHAETHIYGTGHEQFPSNYIKFSTLSNKSFSENDFSSFEKLSIDIFNDSGRDTHTDVYLQTNIDGKGSYYNGNYVKLGKRVLLNGKANYLDFSLERLKYQGLDDVMAVYFVFDNLQIGQPPIKLYIDNFHATKSVKKHEPQYQIRSGRVLSSFEKEQESQMFAVDVFHMPLETMPSFEINCDKNFVTEGLSSLKIVMPVSNYYCNCEDGRWTGFTVAALSGNRFFKGINLNDFDKNDAFVVIDVFNDTETWFNFIVNGRGHYPTPKEWFEIKIPFTALTYNEEGLLNLNFTFNEYVGSGPRTMYVDNIRIETKG